MSEKLGVGIVEAMREILRSKLARIEAIDAMIKKSQELRDDEIQAVAVLKYQLRLVGELGLTSGRAWYGDS